MFVLRTFEHHGCRCSSFVIDRMIDDHRYMVNMTIIKSCFLAHRISLFPLPVLLSLSLPRQLPNAVASGPVPEDYLRGFRPYATTEDALRMPSLPLGLDPATAAAAAAAYYHPSYLPHPSFTPYRWASHYLLCFTTQCKAHVEILLLKVKRRVVYETRMSLCHQMTQNMNLFLPSSCFYFGSALQCGMHDAFLLH